MGLIISTAIAGLALLAMLASTAAWMTLPTAIIYQQSSPERTSQYPVEVIEQGHSYFLTLKQKADPDYTRRQVPIVWFASLGYLFIYWALGGFERVRRLN